MILRWWMMLAACLAAMGCGETQKVEPVALGQRGEACQARNDCEAGLACILGVCSRNDFNLTSSALHCDRVDCQADADCCGDRPSEAPARCDNRTSVCLTPAVPGCITTVCTADDACNGGTCNPGTCSLTGAQCTGDGDCTDTCDAGTLTCAVSGLSCAVDADCSGTCGTRVCNCQNPEYDPTADICTDEECTNVCTLRCEQERCVADTRCTSDLDCASLLAPLCDQDQGACVQCLAAEDCDVDAGQECQSGICRKPCAADEECPLFHRCQSGDCVETGCTSDRECVLAANVAPALDDARLSQCLPSDADPNVGICKIPCENDGACSSEFQICEEGYCRFIGCETDAECRSFLGIVNQTVDDNRPFISRAVCRQ